MFVVNNLANKISLPQDQSYTERALALRKDAIFLVKILASDKQAFHRRVSLALSFVLIFFSGLFLKY